MRPARRPLLQLLAATGILFALPVLLLGFFGDLRKHPDRVRQLRAVLQLRDFGAALEHYYSDCGKYPDATEGLDALVRGHEQPGWRGPYIAEAATADPCGQWYVYDSSSSPPKVTSYGADGVPGGVDFDSDLSSGKPTFTFPETPQERRTRILMRRCSVAPKATLSGQQHPKIAHW